MTEYWYSILYMKPLYVILGQTATGKTKLSLQIAKELNGEIISADSRQVYRGLDIGTAKITVDEMDGITHHMLDIADPVDEIYTVADYVRDGRKILHDIWSRNKTPIVVGGSGMYIDTLVGRMVLDGPASDPAFRAHLESQSLQELCDQLHIRNQEVYATTDLNNKVRVVRALERLALPSADYSQVLDLPEDLALTWIGLRRPMDQLHERIHLRNAERLENGLLEEVQKLHTNGLSWERMETLGLEYRYISRFLRGDITTKDELLRILDTKTNQFAKRQMTWFRKNPDIAWSDPEEDTNILR